MVRSIYANGDSDSELFQMLKKLRATPKEHHPACETSQLIDHIDDAIAHANDSVIKRTLEKAGLSSEEMISLLQESRKHVIHLDGLRKSKLSNLQDCAMCFPVNFPPDSSSSEQAELVLDTIGKAIQHQNYRELLSPYAMAVRQQFSEPPAELIGHLNATAQNAIASQNYHSASAIHHIVQFLEQ